MALPISPTSFSVKYPAISARVLDTIRQKYPVVMEPDEFRKHLAIQAALPALVIHPPLIRADGIEIVERVEEIERVEGAERMEE